MKTTIAKIKIVLLCLLASIVTCGAAFIGFPHTLAGATTSQEQLDALNIIEDETCVVTRVTGTTYQHNENNTQDATTEQAYAGIKLAFEESKTEKAALAGVFTDDFSLRYTSDSTNSRNCWTFIKVYDLEGNELFAVARRQYQYNGWAFGGGVAYFEYNGTYTTRQNSTKGITALSGDPNNADNAWEALGGFNAEGVLPNTVCANSHAGIGNVIFDWDATAQKLTAKTTFVDSTNTETNAKGATVYKTVDLAIGEIDCSNGQNAAVKAAMENGYRVAFEVDSPLTTVHTNFTAMNFILLDINGISLADEFITVEKQEIEGIKHQDEFELDGKPALKVPYGVEVGDFYLTAKKVLSDNYYIGGALVETFTGIEDITDYEVGEHAVTVSHGEYSKEYTLLILPAQELADVIVSEDMDVSSVSYEFYDYGQTEGNKHEVKGLLIPLKTGTTALTAKAELFGVYKGDFEMEYIFSGAGNQGFALFKVYDLDGNELFHIGRTSYQYAHAQGGMGYFYYNGTYTTRIASSYTELYTWPTDSSVELPNQGDSTENWPAHGNTPVWKWQNILPTNVVDGQSTAGKLVFDYDETAEKLYAKVTFGGAGELSIGEIDCSNGQNAAVKAAMENGYKVTVEKDKTNRQGGKFSDAPDIVVCSINGVSLDKNIGLDMSLDVVAFSDAYSEQDERLYVAQHNAEQYVKVEDVRYAVRYPYAPSTVIYMDEDADNVYFDCEDGLSEIGTFTGYFISKKYGKTVCAPFAVAIEVESSYKVDFDENGGQEIEDMYYSEHALPSELPSCYRAEGWDFGGWYDENSQEVTALNVSMGDIVLTAKWIDALPPQVYFNDGIESISVIKRGETVSVAVSDVIADDKACGRLGAENISVRIKVPEANEFISLADFVFDEDLYGFYTIEYTVSDTSNNTATLTRSVKYIPSAPSITLNGALQEQAYVNDKITLPTATALSGSSSIDYKVSVTLDGTQIEVENGAFKLTEMGEYVVVYYATDEYGQTASLKRIINCVEDTEKPVISVDFTVTTLEVGQELVLPTATVTDNADENLTAKIEVFKDGELVAEASFVPTSSGIYAIKYTATDSAGNENFVTFEVLVKGEEIGSASCGSCDSSIGGAGVCIIAGLAMTILLLKKKENE